MLLSFTGYPFPLGSISYMGCNSRVKYGQSHPFLGNEGPGAALLAIGDII
ncbi:MAG: hypothetical protein Ct9H90mP7_5400 [Candidatus Neomarinimicrobiota bacterium]|nr:MAG: hypothetical protein Ct9H90mP7_5400 [Candidatus Neomarinimicrobiota bacterium]